MYVVVMVSKKDTFIIGKSSSYEFCEECESIMSLAYKNNEFYILSEQDKEYKLLNIDINDESISEIISYTLPDDDEIFYIPSDLSEFIDEIIVNLETTIRIGLENLIADLSIFKKKNKRIIELRKSLYTLYKDFDNNYEEGESIMPYKMRIEKLIKYAKFY